MPIPPATPSVVAEGNRKLNRVGKWRSILVGRILGSRPAGDPEVVGFRDLMDKMVILRVETTTLARLMLEKGVFTPDEWFTVMGEEADALDAMYAAAWPGIRTTDDGLSIDPIIGVETLKRQSRP